MLDKTILKIKREFITDEKYRLLLADYKKMEQKVENHKKETLKITDRYRSMRKRYFELEEQYLAAVNKLNKYKLPQEIDY